MDKIILTTGGTGGHIFPALAVAAEIRRRHPDVELLFVGSLNGPEGEAAAKAGISFRGLPVHGFLGRGLQAVPAAFGLGKAFFEALGIIRSFAPNAIAGFGGYASFAPMLAGAMLRVPLLLHEQNAFAGTSNRFLARFAREVCVSWPDTEGFHKRTFLTGNPVRADIARIGAARLIRPEGRKLLVIGGSQGAHGLNEFMLRNAEKFRDAGIQLLHQCGKKEWENAESHYRRIGWEQAQAVPFVENMGKAYEEADLALCRAGASTIAELAAAAMPSVLVPFPFAIKDHQTRNAMVLEKAGGAVLAREKDLEKMDAADLVINLLADGRKRAEMSRGALALAAPEAASSLVDKLERIINSRDKKNEK